MSHFKLKPFGKRNGLQVNPVSLGAMRLPDDDNEAVRVIRHAIDSGLVYIDTCRAYGDSEVKVGKALRDGYRDKVILSTKWSPWIRKFEEDDSADADCVLKRIEESMQRLQVDYLDYYQVWNMHNEECYQHAIRPNGFLEGIERARKKGLVGRVGFTTHMAVADLVKLLPKLDWADIVLITYNLLNTSYAPALDKAYELGLGTIIMNPLGGGNLTGIGSIFDDLIKETGCRDLADLAIRYVLTNPSVDTIISGINKPADADDSIASAAGGPLSAEDYKKINDFLPSLKPEEMNFCTACKYCMPCPQGVEIPHVMRCVFHAKHLKMETAGRNLYGHFQMDWWQGGKDAEGCNACGECLEKCTQKLNIPDEMEYARDVFK